MQSTYLLNIQRFFLSCELLLMLLAAPRLMAHAATACPDPYDAALANGGTVTVYPQGDEHFHYVTDADGYVLEGENGVYTYQTDGTPLPAYSAAYSVSESMSENSRRPANAIQASELTVPAFEQPAVPSVPFSGATTGSRPMRSAAAQADDTAEDEPPVPPEVPALIVLVSFADIQISDHDDAFWYNKLFSTQTGSVNDYYREMSGGTFQFVPVRENYGTANDGIVRANLSMNHPSPEADSSESTTRQNLIISSALDDIAEYINYAPYDTDGDGFISWDELSILFIVAGYERSFDSTNVSQSVWAHQSSVYHDPNDNYLRFNSVKLLHAVTFTEDKVVVGESIGKYLMCGEIWRRYQKTTNNGTTTTTVSEERPLEIGVLCHELGHVLGLPDLYPVRYDGDPELPASQQRVGYLSVMASGSWGPSIYQRQGTQPTHMDPFCRMLLGWASPTVIQPDSQEVYSITTAPESDYQVYLIPTADSSEYFLIENRQLTGYDTGLSPLYTAGGLLIWHIDVDSFDKHIEKNQINSFAGELSVIPEQCGYRNGASSWSQNKLWYLDSNKYNSFSPGSSPSSVLNSAPDGGTANSGVTVNVLSKSGETMQFSCTPNDFELVPYSSDTTAGVQVVNNTGADASAVPFAATYDAQGRLISMRPAAAPLSLPASTLSENAEFENALSNGGKTVLYLWDSLGGLRPYATPFVFE